MPRIDLKVGEQKKHVARALKEIQAGFVIVAPLEHGYVYLADAFSPFAVRAMHVLRGDKTGVVAQVLAQALCNQFWPGLLSVTLRPSSVLNWDLGDDKDLDWFNVRVPKSKFIRALLKASGPLAVASASSAGAEPMLKIDRTQVKDWNVAVVFDIGALKSGPRSTIIEADAGGVRIVREGAISVAEMEKVAPRISWA